MLITSMCGRSVPRLCSLALLAGLGAMPAVAPANPLVSAAQADARTAVLEILEEPGTDVNDPSSNGTTALHWAVYNEDLKLVERLLAAGADPDAANAYDSTPMLEAARAGNAPILQRLLEAGADVESANAEGQTALMTVARSGNVEAARVLLEHGADVDAREEWKGQTALIWAAAQSQPEMVALLIEYGADADIRSTVNDWARQITAEPRVMWRPLGGFTALMYTAREGCTACVRELLAGGADPDKAGGARSTPLLIAILNLNFDAARLLIEGGADVNKWDMRGNQPLYAAVDMNTLPQGGRPDRPTTDDTTALEIIDMLLARGANPNARLKLLIEYRSIKDDRGADPMLTIGATPLLRAAKAFDLPAVERLLAHGAMPSLGNENGITPVMAAAGLGATPIDTRGDYTTDDVEERAVATLEALIEAGADVNASDNRGRTPLHGAAAWGWNSVVEYLVENGADLTAEDADGYQPLDAATADLVLGFGRGALDEGHEDTARLIRSLMEN